LVSKAGAGGHALNIAEGGEPVETPKTTKPDKPAVPPPASETPPPAPTPAPIQETQPPAAPVRLAEQDVKQILAQTNLPKAAQSRLLAEAYADDKALREAIETEIEYVKTLTGSGAPFAQGQTTPPAPTKVSEADYQKSLDAIDRRYGLKA
jgi:hypothetical protein